MELGGEGLSGRLLDTHNLLFGESPSYDPHRPPHAPPTSGTDPHTGASTYRPWEAETQNSHPHVLHQPTPLSMAQHYATATPFSDGDYHPHHPSYHPHPPPHSHKIPHFNAFSPERGSPLPSFSTLPSPHSRYPLVPAPVQARHIPTVQQQLMDERQIHMLEAASAATPHPSPVTHPHASPAISHPHPSPVTPHPPHPSPHTPVAAPHPPHPSPATPGGVAHPQPSPRSAIVAASPSPASSTTHVNGITDIHHHNGHVNGDSTNGNMDNGVVSSACNGNNGSLGNGSHMNGRRESLKRSCRSSDNSFSEDTGSSDACEDSSQVASISSSGGPPDSTSGGQSSRLCGQMMGPDSSSRVGMSSSNGSDTDGSGFGHAPAQAAPPSTDDPPEKPVKKKRKRCGDCQGCQKKDNCGDCAPCRNDKSHQICKMRRCDKLIEKRVSTEPVIEPLIVSLFLKAFCILRCVSESHCNAAYIIICCHINIGHFLLALLR